MHTPMLKHTSMLTHLYAHVHTDFSTRREKSSDSNTAFLAALAGVIGLIVVGYVLYGSNMLH